MLNIYTVLDETKEEIERSLPYLAGKVFCGPEDDDFFVEVRGKERSILLYPGVVNDDNMVSFRFMVINHDERPYGGFTYTTLDGSKISCEPLIFSNSLKVAIEYVKKHADFIDDKIAESDIYDPLGLME